MGEIVSAAGYAIPRLCEYGPYDIRTRKFNPLRGPEVIYKSAFSVSSQLTTYIGIDYFSSVRNMDGFTPVCRDIKI